MTSGGEFKDNLRKERWRVGLSQERLARRTGLHVTTIQKLEYGTRSPSLRTVLRLAKALGIDPRTLLNGLEL